MNTGWHRHSSRDRRWLTSRTKVLTSQRFLQSFGMEQGRFDSDGLDTDLKELGLADYIHSIDEVHGFLFLHALIKRVRKKRVTRDTKRKRALRRTSEDSKNLNTYLLLVRSRSRRPRDQTRKEKNEKRGETRHFQVINLRQIQRGIRRVSPCGYMLSVMS